ncbi:alcohol acetyltransferase [Roridomyces roridus]|uniref:Alcohol acetyltransferase n=1 Tax=Roridomyces roridus TaxID=1738132 RepID=A0AAD7BMH7_9AGAR|nr:alcohol acetyltransferase [Roridomyces roridus]
MSSSNHHLRPVGLFESFHVYRHFLGLDSGPICAARYTNADGAVLTKENLFPALKRVIEEHPSLAVALDAEDSKPVFVKLEKIALDLIVQFTDDKEVEAAIENRLSRPFDTSLPLWRVEVLKDGFVVFIFHHAIGDGLSGVAFHQSLLAALQNTVLSDGSAVVQVPPSISLQPPIEAVTSLRPSLGKMLYEVFSLFAPSSWKPLHTAWTGNPVPNNRLLRTHVKLLTFSAEEMANFTKVCRSHGASITSAIYILAVATASRLVPLNNTPPYKTLSTNVAISLRDVARTPGTVMCDYVSTHHTFPTINPAFSWPAAAAYARELQRQKQGVARQEIGMLMLLFGNIAGFLRSKLGQKRGATFEVSNLGRVAASTEGPWRLGRMIFAQCDSVIGPALKVNVVGDPSGGLSVCLTWGEEAIEKSLAESFASQFQEGLRALLV